VKVATGGTQDLIRIALELLSLVAVYQAAHVAYSIQVSDVVLTLRSAPVLDRVLFVDGVRSRWSRHYAGATVK